MSEYNEGDLVEAVKGDTVIRGRLRRHPVDGCLLMNLTLALESDIAHLEANGYTVTTIEKAKPALPSEPGIYVDKYGRDAWLIATANSRIVCVANRSSDPDKYAPFTRLEPVADTAKKMRDRILEEFKRDTNRSYSEDVAFVATEFGVTS